MRVIGLRRAPVVLVLMVVLFLSFVMPAYAQDGDGQFIFSQDFTLGTGQQLRGGLAVFGGSVTLERDSLVTGDVFVTGGDVQISGRVQGSVAAFGGDIRLASTSVVNGDVSAFGGDVIREDGAVVTGNIVTADGRPFVPAIRNLGSDQVVQVTPSDGPSPWRIFAGPARLLWRIIMAVFWSMVIAALAVLVILVVPKPVDRVKDTLLKAPWASVGMGLLTLVAVALLIVILAILVCTLPLAILGGVALAVAVIAGWAVTGLIVGERIFEGLKVRDYSPVLSVVLGAFLLALLSRIPCIGWLFGIVVASFGVGAVVLSRGGTRTYLGYGGPSPVWPAPEPPAPTGEPGAGAEPPVASPPPEAPDAEAEPPAVPPASSDVTDASDTTDRT